MQGFKNLKKIYRLAYGFLFFVISIAGIILCSAPLALSAAWFPAQVYYTSTKMKDRTEKYVQYRVDRVLGFFSSRPKRNTPPPSEGECVHPLLVPGGTHSLAGEGGRGVPIRTRGQTLWYSRYKVLCDAQY